MINSKRANRHASPTTFLRRRNCHPENWRHAVDEDPALTTASTLARREFYDHIPAVLDAFEQISASALSVRKKRKPAQEQKEHAAEHGLHRWHHGYNQQDVMREWGHLHFVLVNELENYAALNRWHRRQRHADRAPRSGRSSAATASPKAPCATPNFSKSRPPAAFAIWSRRWRH